jgi:hypothetical protein
MELIYNVHVLSGVVVIVLVTGLTVCGFKPGWEQWISKKI